MLGFFGLLHQIEHASPSTEGEPATRYCSSKLLRSCSSSIERLDLTGTCHTSSELEFQPAVTRYYWSKLYLSSDSLLSDVTMASAIIRIRFPLVRLFLPRPIAKSHFTGTFTGWGFKRETFAVELGHVESPKIKRAQPLALATLIAPLIGDFDVLRPGMGNTDG